MEVLIDFNQCRSETGSVQYTNACSKEELAAQPLGALGQDYKSRCKPLLSQVNNVKSQDGIQTKMRTVQHDWKSCKVYDTYSKLWDGDFI